MDNEHDRRDTVIVEKERSSNPLGWVIAIILIILLIIAAIYYIPNLLGGADTVNVSTPDTVNVQPVTGE